MKAPVLEVEEKKGLQKHFLVDGMNLAALPRRAASFLQTRSALLQATPVSTWQEASGRTS
jgi:hypothetical protein